MTDREFSDWVERARAVPIGDEVGRRSGMNLKHVGAELIGPCPRCDGEDRFAVNIKKNVFNCRGCGAKGDVIALAQHLDGVDFKTACTTLAGPPPANGKTDDKHVDASKKIVVATFDYPDQSGKLLFAVDRIEFQNLDGTFVLKDGKRKKSFRQKRPDPDHPKRWINNVDGVPVVPYCLPELIDAIAHANVVAIPEGEAKVDLLRSWNIAATCCAGGARSWTAEHAGFLRDADVVILPDNDHGGHLYEQLVGSSLQGIAKSVRVLELPGLPPKGDIIDFAKAGGTREQFDALLATAPKWFPRPPGDDESWRKDMISARDLCTMRFAPLKFIIPHVIPEGLTILAGRPKIGKSWLTLLIGIALANGVAALGLDYGATMPPRGSVLYLCLEDGRRRLQRRMTKLIGAQPENWPAQLYLKTDWRRLDQGGLDDIRAWYDHAKGKGENPILIIVDTLVKVRAPGNPKASPYQNDHDALAGLQRLAGELGIAVVVNHHDRKMDAEDVFDTVSGTLGLTGAVDTILVLTKKAQGTTLHIRGRDLEDETPLALQFNNGRWSVLGSAAEIQRSDERTRIIKILTDASDGLPVAEIVAGANLRSSNAAYSLLFKLAEAGDIERMKHGVYGLPGTTAKIKARAADAARGRKIGKKERSEPNDLENQCDTNLSANLSDGNNGKIANALNEQGNGSQSFHLSDLSGPQPDADLTIPSFLDRRAEADRVCAQCHAGRPGDLPTVAVKAKDGSTVYVHEHGCLRFWKMANGTGACS